MCSCLSHIRKAVHISIVVVVIVVVVVVAIIMPRLAHAALRECETSAKTARLPATFARLLPKALSAYGTPNLPAKIIPTNVA